MDEALFIPVVRAKLQRASELTDELQKQIKSFLRAEDFYIEAEPEGDHSWILTLRMRREPPFSMSILVSDILHNLRSSLDLALFHYLELAVPEGFDKLDRKQKLTIKFPIADTSQGYSRIDWHAGLEVPQLRKDLLTLQPFNLRREFHLTETSEEILERNLLRQFRDMSNADKHREIQLVVSNLKLMTLSQNAGDLKSWTLLENPPWRDGSQIYRVTFHGPDNNVEDHLNSHFDVVLANDSLGMNSQPLVNKLSAIQMKVTGCHNVLKKWFDYIEVTGP